MGNYTIPEGVEVIVFDEILLNNLPVLGMIKRFMENNVDTYKFVANGDINQLHPINFGTTNIQDEKSLQAEMRWKYV